MATLTETKALRRSRLILLCVYVLAFLVSLSKVVWLYFDEDESGAPGDSEERRDILLTSASDIADTFLPIIGVMGGVVFSRRKRVKVEGDMEAEDKVVLVIGIFYAVVFATLFILSGTPPFSVVATATLVKILRIFLGFVVAFMLAWYFNHKP